MQDTKPTAADFRQYLRLHAIVARAEKRMAPLKDKIKPYLEAGGKSPRDLPYLLVLQKRTRTLADWKGVLTETLRRWLGSETKAKDAIQDIEAGFEKREELALCVQVNTSYAAKL